MNPFIRFMISRHPIATLWHWPLTGLLLTLALTANASTLDTATTQSQKPSSDTPAGAIAQRPEPMVSLPDGTYLYGESSVPEQVGKEYIVFKAHQGKLVGALYFPSSEFSCFQGTLDASQMNLTLASPYDDTTLAQTIPRTNTAPQTVAAAGGSIDLGNSPESVNYPYTVGLEGYQPINQLSDNDQRILRICQNNYNESN